MNAKAEKNNDQAALDRRDFVKLGSLGKVVPGYETQIVGPDGEPVPDGEPGRLRVRGGSTALCYWADKAKTRESSRKRPTTPRT